MTSSKPPRTPRRLGATFREPGGLSGTPLRDSSPSAQDSPLQQPEIRDDPVTEMDRLLADAVRAGASDLHLDPTPEGLAVRYRVDGILERVALVPDSLRAALVSRVKVMAGMDIAIKRRPQDGGFGVRRGAITLAIRVSTLPVEGGEKTVLRILDPSRLPTTLDAVGLLPGDLARVRDLVEGAHGAVLVVGPTGSGKSSTLFGALAEMDRETRNVVTLEDPIETRVAGVNQVQVSPRAGLTFPAALRAVLRQDPDVIMVGEIRDAETAEIAMASAMTGHLVLSSLHSTDAPSAVVRLLQMGVAPYLVAGGLRGVIAQRLVRRSCPHCRAIGRGCRHCKDGYRGRVGIFEVLALDDVLREEITRNRGLATMQRLLVERGCSTMAADARQKITLGWTTETEVVRMIGPLTPEWTRPVG